MLLNRHRIAKLIELADLERRLAGPERLLREEDVALLVKAAYDDASEAARAAFMARVQPMPVAAWPWSAVQVKVVRGNGGGVAAGSSLEPVGAAIATEGVGVGRADGTLDLDQRIDLATSGRPTGGEIHRHRTAIAIVGEVAILDYHPNGVDAR